MKKEKYSIYKRIFISIITFIILTVIPIVSKATVSIEEIDTQSTDVSVKITSDKKLKNICIYTKDASGKYVLFYKSTPNNTTEKVCTISSSRLSKENKTTFKIVVTEEDNVRTEVELVADELSETVLPSSTPSASPTPSVSPSVSVTPSASTTPTPTPSVTVTPSTSATVSPSTSNVPTASQTPVPTVTPEPSVTPVVQSGKPIYNYDRTGTVLKKYSNDSINVSVEKISKYYVAKIWVKNPELQVKKKEAGWGKNLLTVNTMLNSTPNAIIGCNGSGFYRSGSWEPRESAIKKTAWNKTTEGYLVMSNGIIRRKINGQKCNALLGILPSGKLKYYENNKYSDVINDGVKDTFTFGPTLIKDGKKYTQAVGKPRQSYNGSAAKRTAIGQIDENNYVIIVTASTAKLTEMANFGLTLDCNFLYNLDGGGSSTLWFRNAKSGKGTQVKSSSRGVGDALYFTSL